MDTKIRLINNQKTIKLENIPNELKLLKQWVVCDKGKIPYVPGTNRRASITDPKTWGSFDAAVRYIKHGIGFVFTSADPYCFIDLDKCCNNGTIDQWALNIIKKLNSYTEMSISGTGIHILVKAKLPENTRNRKDRFEIYDNKRYCIITGRSINIVSQRIEERQAEIDELYQEIFNEPKPIPIPKTEAKSELLSDDEIINLIGRASNGDKFSRLFAGNISGYPSQSEADLAFVSMLAFYTQDYDQILRIVRQSGLWRDKWERSDYQRRTIDKALSGVSETYRSDSNGGNGGGRTMKQEAGKPQAESIYFKEGIFIPKFLADELMAEYIFICVDNILFLYQDGVFKPIGDSFVETECYKKLGEKARVNRVTEVLKYIKALTRVDRERLNTHKYLINLKNGMLDINSLELSRHSEEYLSTIRIPIIYDPKADGAFVDDWLKSTLGDRECINLAYELFGYCLIPDTTMAKAFMLVGSGANGKSTFLRVLENFIGSDNVSKIPLQELADNRFKRADLLGKLVNMFADLDSRALESTSYFKTVVSGDSIDAERKNRDPFEFKPFARLIFSANEIPRARDRSFAYYRRWCIIPFEKQFTGTNDKKNLAEELSEPNNLSALLNFALLGLKRVFKKQGFTEPDRVRIALQEYERQNDPVKAFLNDCCELNLNTRIERQELYDKFCSYCLEAGFKTVPRNSFYQSIRTIREVSEVRERDGRYFVGINYKSQF